MDNTNYFRLHKNHPFDRDLGMGVYVAGTGGVTPKKQLTDDDIEAAITNYDPRRAKKPFSVMRREKLGTEILYDTTEDNPIEECMALSGLEALNNAGYSIGDVGEIHISTISPTDRLASSRSAIIERMGFETAPVFNLSHVCAGSMYALESARRAVLIKDKPVLAIAGDNFRNVIDKSDWTQAGIFSAGAAAALLIPGSAKNYGLKQINFWSDPGWHKFARTNQETGKFLMNGKELGIRAPIVFKTFYDHMISQNDFDKDKVYVVPHQLNGHLIESFRVNAGLRQDQVLNNVNKIGNTSNGSVLLALHYGLSKRIKKDDQVLLFGIGIGFDFAYGPLIPHETLIQPQIIKVLLYDSDREILQTKRTKLKSYLGNHPRLPENVNIRFDTASTVDEALNRAIEQKPDILDFNMGFENEPNCVDMAALIHEKLGPIPTIINVNDSSPYCCAGMNFIKLVKFTQFRPLSESCDHKRYAEYYIDLLFRVNVL